MELMYFPSRALVYRRKYRTNDRFDNYYLTLKLRDVEERRKERGKEGIFPLKTKESWKYIKTCGYHVIKLKDLLLHLM